MRKGERLHDPLRGRVMWRLYETGRWTLDEIGAIWQIGKTRVSEILADMGHPTGALRYVRPRECGVVKPHHRANGVTRKANRKPPPAARVDLPAPPPPPTPTKILYHGVQVRRFERGGIAEMCNRALAEAGYGSVTKCADKLRPYMVDGKRYGYKELLAMVDKIRTKRGYPAIGNGREPEPNKRIHRSGKQCPFV